MTTVVTVPLNDTVVTPVEEGVELVVQTTRGAQGPRGFQGDQGIQGIQGIQGEPGDATTNTAVSVDGEIALFSGTSGKLLKRATGSGIAGMTAGVLAALSSVQATAMLNAFTSALKGLVPASGGGTTKFLRADGTFEVPAYPTIPGVFTSGASGLVPASGGGTANFLRADGTFAAPAYPAAANPSAPLGLATVNGVATTYMRSDAAPALSQAITPTWTGPHVFTAAGTNASPTIELSSANPFLIFNETDGTTDNRRWKFRVDGESFQATVLNDANSVAGTWLNVERTGTAIDSAAFPTTANGSFLVGRTSSIAPGIGVAQISGGTATALCAYVTSAPAQALRCFSDVNIGNNYFVTFNTEANTERGSIIFNRGSGVVAYNTTSDRRRKKNIADAPSASDIVESLRVRAFDWKDSGNHVSHWLVAQEVHEVFPMAVSVGDEERDWAIDPAKLVPLLVKELQSLRARVATLEQRT